MVERARSARVGVEGFASGTEPHRDRRGLRGECAVCQFRPGPVERHAHAYRCASVYEPGRRNAAVAARRQPHLRDVQQNIRLQGPRMVQCAKHTP